MSDRLLYQTLQFSEDEDKVGIYPVTLPVMSTILTVEQSTPGRVIVYSNSNPENEGTEYWIASVAPSGKIPSPVSRFIGMVEIEGVGRRAFFELMR